MYVIYVKVFVPERFYTTSTVKPNPFLEYIIIIILMWSTFGRLLYGKFTRHN